jgi:hypothetical protein
MRYNIAQNEKLIYESEQNAKLKYELMLKTIEENSEYYTSFSKIFLSEFEKSDYDQIYAIYGSFYLENVFDKLEKEINSELVGEDSVVRNEIGIIYSKIKYPYDIWIIDNFSDDGTPLYKIYYYWIVYIPDEYMNDELIATLNKEVYSIDLKELKGNLFLASYTPPYI